ncbi:pre-mRNA-splicing factor SF3A3, of SF3a complex, prp9 domain-containing protein [Ditylenchus destructor]|nr:pre-mRNA-splicing factor SF3A3, of SF3a complex, prp9 domain-containing protein [Ditylenchus destructor]
MESLLEVQRNCHEERERCIELMVVESLTEKRSQKEKINSDQRIKSLVDRYQNASQKLAEVYTDDNAEREKEIQAIAGPNEFAEFYSRLKVLKDIHRKNPNETARPLTIEFQEMINFAQDPDRVEREIVRFTDEEGYGKFLDMHLLFDQYLNLKGVKRTDYISYISSFDHFADIPKETKKSGAYKTYVEALLDYLKDFLQRAKPLLDLDGKIEEADKEFEQKWVEDKVPGWTKEKGAKALSNTAVPLDLSVFNSVEELEALGLDRLKSALMAANLKCGGTLRQRAERLFNTKKLGQDNESEVAKNHEQESKEEKRMSHIAKMEYRVTRLADSVPYNPKNLPLGWDGKPIPYWLYKLHGLNIGYSCEICGNQVYKGPKTFQRHFTEWRHSHGMRCLGIPNTAHFANITKISDAMELWKKICEEKKHQRWNPEADEEFEDSLGNVVNAATYRDLKRQGLL